MNANSNENFCAILSAMLLLSFFLAKTYNDIWRVIFSKRAETTRLQHCMKLHGVLYKLTPPSTKKLFSLSVIKTSLNQK